MVFICLLIGNKIDQKDINDCGLAHWAAYTDNSFLLKFAKNLKFSFKEKDKQRYSPFGRACMNFSYEAIDFFIEQDPQLAYSQLTKNELMSNSILNKYR